MSVWNLLKKKNEMMIAREPINDSDEPKRKAIWNESSCSIENAILRVYNENVLVILEEVKQKMAGRPPIPNYMWLLRRKFGNWAQSLNFPSLCSNSRLPCIHSVPCRVDNWWWRKGNLIGNRLHVSDCSNIYHLHCRWAHVESRRFVPGWRCKRVGYWWNQINLNESYRPNLNRPVQCCGILMSDTGVDAVLIAIIGRAKSHLRVVLYSFGPFSGLARFLNGQSV